MPAYHHSIDKWIIPTCKKEFQEGRFAALPEICVLYAAAAVKNNGEIPSEQTSNIHRQGELGQSLPWREPLQIRGPVFC